MWSVQQEDRGVGEQRSRTRLAARKLASFLGPLPGAPWLHPSKPRAEAAENEAVEWAEQETCHECEDVMSCRALCVARRRAYKASCTGVASETGVLSRR